MAHKKQQQAGKKALRRQEAVQRAKRRRQLRMGGGGLVALGVIIVGLLVFGAGSGGETALAAEFELDQLDGESVKLSDYRGAPVAVTFMHSW